MRESRVYVKASPEEQDVFRAVAQALGQGDIAMPECAELVTEIGEIGYAEHFSAKESA